MCKFCDGVKEKSCYEKEGKTLLSMNENVAEWITYGGGYRSEERTFEVKICGDKLAVGHFPTKYTDSIKNSVKINYCPMCGRKIKKE